MVVPRKQVSTFIDLRFIDDASKLQLADGRQKERQQFTDQATAYQEDRRTAAQALKAESVRSREVLAAPCGALAVL